MSTSSRVQRKIKEEMSDDEFGHGEILQVFYSADDQYQPQEHSTVDRLSRLFVQMENYELRGHHWNIVLKRILN